MTAAIYLAASSLLAIAVGMTLRMLDQPPPPPDHPEVSGRPAPQGRDGNPPPYRRPDTSTPTVCATRSVWDDLDSPPWTGWSS